MYTSFSIENFRLFDKLTVEPLARVNLIAGDNNVGKTALLEALWLLGHPTAPREALRVFQWRGSNNYGQAELFADLFFQFNAGLAINIRAEDMQECGSDTLGITRQDRSQQALFDWSSVSENEWEDDAIANFDFDNELVFEHTNESGIKFRSSVWLDAETVSGRLRPILRESRESAVTPRRPCAFEHPKSKYNARALAALFGRAEMAEYRTSLEAIVRSLEPRLERLITITDSRGIPAIHGDIGVGRLFPIAIMGEGIKRLLSLSLAFLKAQNGVMLVDEVENGLHHTVLPDVWKNLDWLSREFNVQIFATTHSYECIAAALSAFTELESSELNLHRLYRRGGKSKAITYTKEMLDTNIEYSWELR